mmetsp:Transcript_11403/g.18264  ORF Transcript_11403/g.18264 Transcript_11403/m.18264 type:complete len:99 (+) Transcript_11403:349-645(+)
MESNALNLHGYLATKKPAALVFACSPYLKTVADSIYPSMFTAAYIPKHCSEESCYQKGCRVLKYSAAQPPLILCSLSFSPPLLLTLSINPSPSPSLVH